MMTRKDYVTTAEILRDAISFAKENSPENSQAFYHSIETVQFIAEELSEFFANDNKNFDEEKFLMAVHK